MEFEKLKAYQQVLLSQAYSKGLQENEEKFKTYTQYRDRHKKITEELETLRKQLKINCMVPLGKRALIKGQLVHTNEILVDIGDGYFVKKSADKAIELCNRRILNCNEMLEKLEKERNFFEIKQMLPFDCDAFESEESKNLVEYWDDKKLENWRVEHRKKQKEYAEKLKLLKEKKSTQIESEDDLFKRLDELELQEELEDEFNRLEEERRNFYGDDLMEGEVYEESEEDENESKESNESEEFEEESSKQVNSEKNNDTELKDKNQIVDNETSKEVLLKPEEIKVSDKPINNILEDSKDKFSEALVENKVVENFVNKEINNREVQINRQQTQKLNNTKINGKFEVSIIKEEEARKIIEQTNMPLKQPMIHKPPSFKYTKKSRKHKKLIEINELEKEGKELQLPKDKSTGRRVSFAEPNCVHVFESSNEDSLFFGEICDEKSISDVISEEQSSVEKFNKNENNVQKSSNDQDDIIKIEFKHSEVPSFEYEGSENKIISPKDIHRIFCKPKPKSILKRSLNDLHINHNYLFHDYNPEEEKYAAFQDCSSEEDNDVNFDLGASTYNEVVKSVIKERAADEDALITLKKEDSKSINKVKPVSRFRMERTASKN